MILSFLIRSAFCNLQNNRRPLFVRVKTITIHEKFDGSLDLYIRGIKLNYIELKQRPSKPKEDPIVIDRIPRKPAANHPWRGNLDRHTLSSSPNGGY